VYARSALTGLFVVAMASVPSGARAGHLDHASAERAVRASIALIPGDDISNDFRGHDILLADLDGDGVNEILYRLTARCIGANFDCRNELVVMTVLEPGDARGLAQNPGLSPQWDADLAAVRDSGYAGDASAQIPGDVERIGVSGGRIEVVFEAREDSPACLRPVSTAEGYRATTHCPAPGRHVWTYAWQPGELRRIGTADGKAARP
jgi:hypothetical protein